MRTGIFPGSFDPPTIGHIDIATRASAFLDKLIVAIGTNTSKKSNLIQQEERKVLLTKALANIQNIEIVIFKGLLTDYINENNIDVIVRSMRSQSDFDCETARATLNRKMSGVETIWWCTDPSYRDVSSSLVREIGALGGPLRGLVPPQIIDDVERAF